MCLENPCDPETNPEGHIALCVAENTLVQEMLANRLMKPAIAAHAFGDSVSYCYNGMLGLPGAREALAYFLARRFLLAPDGGKSSVIAMAPTAENVTADRINPEHVAIGAGAASILNNLFFILAEAGTGVLVPAPFYAAFVNDMRVVAGCVPIPVYSNDPVKGPTIEELQLATEDAERNLGLNVKMLLLTNPNNPLGTVYQPQAVLDMISWARGRGMHTIVDEIYALSMHKMGNDFVSVIRLLNNQLGDDVHFIWALSKDFGASGFRVGVLYTQNDLLLQALANLNIFSCVSHPMQMIMADLLMDDSFVDSFLAEARLKLRRSYNLCIAKLDEMVVTYTPAGGGIFVYCDFSSIFPEQTFEMESKFRTIVEKYARVVMTPGESQYDRKPGRFRICYAWVTEEVLEIAMERLSYLISKLRKMDWWNEVQEEYLSDVVSKGGRDRMIHS